MVLFSVVVFSVVGICFGIFFFLGGGGGVVAVFVLFLFVFLCL